LHETADLFARVLALYDEGQCLDAWEAGKVRGSLADWPLVEPRILAARLAYYLGAPRLSFCLGVGAFRAHRQHPQAQYYQVLRTWDRRGALAAWRERCRLGAPAASDALAHADYLGQCAGILGMLRDFDAAESYITRSRAAAERPFWYVERAGLFELEDRYPEALAAAREGLAAHPRYPPTIRATARALELLDRTDEALALLRSAAADSQNSAIVAQLIASLLKRRLLDEAEAAVTRYDIVTPLKEEEAVNLIAATRAETAVQRGDYRTAMELVEQVKHPFYASVAQSLRSFLAQAPGTSPRRVELDVPFVRQHHLTCSPATLSAISQFWQRPANHVEVAEEICYDGTPCSSERRWANENGWRTAEFRVDWASATALLDRGIAFTFTMRDASSGHLLAAIGYDQARDVILVRDPMHPGTGEIKAREMFEQQRAMGPRGMAMVPLDQSGLLDGLSLPESGLYDLYHELELALERHDRDGALEPYQRMMAVDPRHRLTWNARRALAAYDDNPHEALAAVDGLLELYPDDSGLQLSRLANLRRLASRDDRLTWLARICNQPGADPLLWIEYAVELKSDTRLLPRARHFIRRALRRRPDDANGIQQLARVTWGLGARTEAIELYRFAACLHDVDEDAARDYFNACRWHHLTDTGLAFLRARVERLGPRSGQPAATLFGALEALDRMTEAFAVLDAAVAQHPHDPMLRLFAANRNAAWGRPEEAVAHRAAASHGKRTVLLAEEARAARLAGDRARALAAWREILELRPLDSEAHHAVAQLLSETSDADAAARHLRTFCDRFPQNGSLHRLLYEWTAHRPADARERVLRELRAIDAADVWTVRELALNLCGQARFAEAVQLTEEALALDHNGAISHNVRAWVLHRAGRTAEAAASYRAAITRSADVPGAINGLLDTAGETRAESIAVLTFVEAQLLAQPVIGDGVLVFREAARGILTPAELLLPLERLHAQRPDLWQSWSALSIHLADMGRTEEALGVALRATERFSLVPRVWLDLSRVHRARHELDFEIAALRRCHELSPEWTEPILHLAGALERADHLDESQHTLEAAIHLTPLEPVLRGHLAALLHRRDKSEAAIATLRETLRINPDYEWAWEALTEWTHAKNQATSALDLARATAEERPAESHAWVRLADLHIRVGRLEEALDVLGRTLQINPQDVAAYDLQASALAQLRRFAAAEAACHPPTFGAQIPLVLLGRAAKVQAMRGDLSGAITNMQQVVDAHPDYLWGWHQLLNWRARMENWDEAIRAAERLAWLEPHNAEPIRWIGDLKQRQGDNLGAAEAFRRAMRLEPSDGSAGFQLVGILRAEHDYAGARRTLDILRQFAARDDILAAEAELAVAEGDLPSYLARLHELCGNADGGEAPATRAVDAPVRATWRPEIERALKAVMEGATWNPITPMLWVRVRAHRQRLGGTRSYRWLAGLGEPGKRAIIEVLDHIAQAIKRSRTNGWLTNARLKVQLHLIRHYCRAWEGDNRYWGYFGYALTNYARPRWAVRWLSDWARRPNVEPWMVQNLASALLSLHRGEPARALLRTVATTMGPRVDLGVVLAMWCVIGACIDNDVPLAERLLHTTPRDREADKHRSLVQLATTLLAVFGDRSERASLTTERALSLEGAVKDLERFRDSRYLARLALLAAARHARDPWRTLGAWWRLYRRPLIFAAMLAWLALAILVDLGRGW
jgi:tetratricopeptide (TPR) repeat protein